LLYQLSYGTNQKGGKGREYFLNSKLGAKKVVSRQSSVVSNEFQKIFYTDRVYFTQFSDKQEKGGIMSTGVENLIVYQKSFGLAMRIFEISKSFPKDEKYSMNDRIRRSSRAVSANLAEASCKRRYEGHFISKLSDSDMENSETQVWLNFALNSKYISDENYQELIAISREVGKLIDYMIHNPAKFARNN